MRNANVERPQTMNFYFTIDVDWFPRSQGGLLRLYDFCERFHLKPTLFVTGRFADAFRELLCEASARGYEIGTHGWEHGLNRDEDFRSGTYNEQKRWLGLSTDAVVKATGKIPTAFRAPNLSISETTLRVLEEMHYTVDSSVPARRFDLGYGQVSNPRYFMAPLRPYHPSLRNLAREGSSPVLEVPPSAFLVPINMSSLRMLGLATVKWAIRRIAKRSSILVFYGHPAEFEFSQTLQMPPELPARYRKGLGPFHLDLLGRFVAYVLSLGYVSASFSAVLGNGDGRDTTSKVPEPSAISLH